MMKHDDFERIYGEYYVLAMRIAYYVMGNCESAQDVVQDVFVKMYQSLPTVNESLIRYWLAVNIKRRAIDFFRKERTYREVYGRDNLLHRIESPEESPEMIAERMDAKVFCGRILAALQEKNLQWYELMVRIVIEGEDPELVAEEYGLSVRHVRTMMHRARVWIRGEFGTEYQSLRK